MRHLGQSGRSYKPRPYGLEVEKNTITNMYTIVNFDSTVEDEERKPWEIILHICMSWTRHPKKNSLKKRHLSWEPRHKWMLTLWSGLKKSLLGKRNNRLWPYGRRKHDLRGSQCVWRQIAEEGGGDKAAELGWDQDPRFCNPGDDIGPWPKSWGKLLKGHSLESDMNRSAF